MENEFVIGIGTIGVGVVTALVHIYVTYRSGKTSLEVSSRNLEQQRKLFAKTKTFDYLLGKKEFLEKASSGANVNQSAEIRKDDNYFAKFAEIITKQIRSLDSVLKEASHYLDSSSLDRYFAFSSSFWSAKTQAQISTHEENRDAAQDIKEFEEKILQATEHIEFGRSLIKNELRLTVTRIERIIKTS